jgi:hypothetical protein
MALRKSSRVKEPTSQESSQELKTNPEIDLKIDDFIRNNPKQFGYYFCFVRISS